MENNTITVAASTRRANEAFPNEVQAGTCLDLNEEQSKSAGPFPVHPLFTMAWRQPDGYIKSLAVPDETSLRGSRPQFDNAPNSHDSSGNALGPAAHL